MILVPGVWTKHLTDTLMGEPILLRLVTTSCEHKKMWFTNRCRECGTELTSVLMDKYRLKEYQEMLQSKSKGVPIMAKEQSMYKKEPKKKPAKKADKKK